MKRTFSLFVAAGAGVLLATIGQPTFAQTGPSQDEFGRALRPIPRALQTGHQGITTAPPAMRAGPNPNYSTASASRPIADTGTRRVRNAAQGNHVDRTPAAALPAATLPGCPGQTDSSGKPAIGFAVSFEFGSAQLKPEALGTLRNLGRALNEELRDQKLFVIEGHTDAVGTIAYNEELSRLRAEAVKDFLVRETGVSPERLDIAGKAYCHPANPQNPRGAENRRVVVVNQSS